MPKKHIKSSGYRVIKKEYNDNSNDTSSDTSSDNSSDNSTGTYKYKTINNTTYSKPAFSKQDSLTKSEIKSQLKGYKALRTAEEKEELVDLKPFKVWIKYFNTVKKEFRIGGLLKLVDYELRYIMLVNLNNKITWSVQLKDCIIFIPKDLDEFKREKELEKNEEEKQLIKEQSVKNKLYKLYKQDKLTVK